MATDTKTSNGTQNNVEKSVGRQAFEILQIIGDVLFLLLKIFYYIGESIYRKLVPVPPKEVKGQVVLITGTGHGIGRQLAYQYAAAGAIVVGWDVNEKGNEETFQEIAKRGYQKGHRYVCDVSKREEVLRCARRVEQEVGEVDVLINNAGIMPCHPLEKHTPEEIDRILKINTYAHFWTLEAFLPNMIKNNQGHVVALSSCAGLFGIKNLVPYCASKFAVKGLMEALFEELRENPKNRIRLTTVFPYMTNTGLCKKPKIRFENVMPMVEPEDLAKEIIDAQRNDVLELTVPRYLLGVNNYTRLLPVRAQMAVKDFLDAYVESDL